MFEKLKNKMVSGCKDVMKEECVKSLDDIIPSIFSIASIAVIILSCIPNTRPSATTITINNYYF